MTVFGDKMQDDTTFIERGKQYLSRSADLSKTVQDLVRIAAEAVGSNMGALFLLDAQRRVLKPAVVINLPKEFVDGVGEIPVGEQCCGRVVLHGIPWYVEDIWHETLFPPESRAGARRAGVRAGFSVPVLDPMGRSIGALSAHFPDSHVPTQYEIRRQELFANLISCALFPPLENEPATLQDARPMSSEALSGAAAD